MITEEDLDWDFAIEDFEGNVLEFYGLSFAECDVEGATLIWNMTVIRELHRYIKGKIR